MYKKFLILTRFRLWELKLRRFFKTYKTSESFYAFENLKCIQNAPCSIEHGAFIAHLVAVFYGVFGAIRTPANPHEYWTFYSSVIQSITKSAISIIIFFFLFSHISRYFFSSFFRLHSAYQHSISGNSLVLTHFFFR